METMHDLLVHELRDLYNAEKQLTKALPKMVKNATNDTLAEALESHLEETEAQIERLDECFALLEVSSRGKKCAGMEGLIKEGSDVMSEAEDDDVRDAAIIAAAQRIEHYEISAYGTARAFALKLGHDEIAELLGETLEEEAAADEKLSGIAESEVNFEAAEDDEDEEEEVRSSGARGGRKGTASRR